jgi:DNA-binding MarR family transcriptional regulator
MKSYQLVEQLLKMVEKFESQTDANEMQLPNFVGFLNAQLQHNPATAANDVRFGQQEDEAKALAHQLDNSIARLFVYMSRYAKSYIKKALADTLLQSPEDFTCLAILLTNESLSKTELISRNLQEKTSGAEVIKRLLAVNLIHQWDDENDRRGKRLSITEKGKTLLYQIFNDMNHVGKMVSGNLTNTEKHTLHYLLQKLENFHYDLHTQKSIRTKQDIFEITERLEKVH